MSTNKRFIVEKFLSENIAVINNSYYNHIKNVLRIKISDKVVLLDGKGNMFLGIIEKIDRTQILAKIIDKIHKEKDDKYVCCAYSIPKGEKHDFLIEKLTEIGIKEIMPVKFNYSVDYTFDNNSNKYKRMKKIINTSMMQSVNPYKPILHTQTSFDEMINTYKYFNVKIYGNPDSSLHISDIIDKISVTSKTICVIGPEGGFTEQEKETLEAAEFQGIRLSNNILKIETAAILLCGILLATTTNYE